MHVPKGEIVDSMRVSLSPYARLRGYGNTACAAEYEEQFAMRKSPTETIFCGADFRLCVLAAERFTVVSPMDPLQPGSWRCSALECQHYDRHQKASLCRDIQP
jgi:hypothetical protein